MLHTRHPHSLTPEDCLWFEALAPSPMSFEKACRAFPAPGQHMAFGQAVFCWGCSKYIDVSSNKATTLQCSVNISASGIGVQVVFPPNFELIKSRFHANWPKAKTAVSNLYTQTSWYSRNWNKVSDNINNPTIFLEPCKKYRNHEGQSWHGNTVKTSRPQLGLIPQGLSYHHIASRFPAGSFQKLVTKRIATYRNPSQRQPPQFKAWSLLSFLFLLFLLRLLTCFFFSFSFFVFLFCICSLTVLLFVILFILPIVLRSFLSVIVLLFVFLRIPQPRGTGGKLRQTLWNPRSRPGFCFHSTGSGTPAWGGSMLWVLPFIWRVER